MRWFIDSTVALRLSCRSENCCIWRSASDLISASKCACICLSDSARRLTSACSSQGQRQGMGPREGHWGSI